MLRPYKGRLRRLGLNVASTVLVSFAAKVTFWLLAELFMTNAMV